jgi:hypothetical protein
MSGRYAPGDEDRLAAERDIFTAFAVRRARFPERPAIETLHGLSIDHIGFDRDGTASARPTRAGMVLELTIGDESVAMLNVHLKSACHAHSLAPVYDTSRTGMLNRNRYDCRTLAAQVHILENWIEQQWHLGRSVVVLGDFNRQLNRRDDSELDEHFWRMVNDGTSPDGPFSSVSPSRT